MLGQVEGGTADDVAYWLATQPAAWRDQIRYVAIDMCTVFVAAIRRYLPNATIVVDHFHLVQLANDTVAEVRRRTATTLRGRRGRASDPEYTIRNSAARQPRGPVRPRIHQTVEHPDRPRRPRAHHPPHVDRERRTAPPARPGPHQREPLNDLPLAQRFYTWCADAAIPDLERLATTIDTWWPAIEAFLHTGITNAASEGYNRVVKLDARNAYGYRNPANQRLRTRYATIRAARRPAKPG